MVRPDTPQWLDQHDEEVAFLDLDCDIYASTARVLQLLKDRIGPGTIIHFDELFGYYGWRHHEFRALSEFLAETQHKIEYLFYGATYTCCRIV